jgi:RNA polymerase subunit RPABC4/transcription elongation factor Spt4
MHLTTSKSGQFHHKKKKCRNQARQMPGDKECPTMTKTNITDTWRSSIEKMLVALAWLS